MCTTNNQSLYALFVLNWLNTSDKIMIPRREANDLLKFKKKIKFEFLLI